MLIPVLRTTRSSRAQAHVAAAATIHIMHIACNFHLHYLLKFQSLLFKPHSLTFKKHCILSTQCIYVFCVNLRTNSDYFPIQHKLDVFITETESIYCAVRTGFLYINPPQLSGHYMYRQFNIHQFHVQPTQCIYVYCVDLRTNSDYFPIQH